MDDLLQRLTKSQDIIFESRTNSLSEMKHRLVDLKFVFITFTGTKGGTELGINVNQELSNYQTADFETGTGMITIIGECTLNYHKVRCTAEVDLSTKTGKGHLEILD